MLSTKIIVERLAVGAIKILATSDAVWRCGSAQTQKRIQAVIVVFKLPGLVGLAGPEVTSQIRAPFAQLIGCLPQCHQSVAMVAERV